MYVDVPLYVPDEVKEAISNDFQENCDNYLLQSLAYNYLFDRFRGLPIHETEIIEFKGEEYRYEYGSVHIMNMEIRGSFAKVEIRALASLSDYKDRSLKSLHVIVRMS
jgi:hypothetical protein